MQIHVYDEAQKERWDRFVSSSKNGTFLFLRDYMDYHQDRFCDHSLLIENGNGQLLALLPAHRDGAAFISHAGLTYGGFITSEAMKVPKMLEVFEAVLSYLQEKDFSKFIYKTIPYIYHRVPAEEDRYALSLCDASVTRRGVLTAISTKNKLPFQERRERGVRRALQNHLTVRHCDDYASFWKILSEVLQRTYNTQPVHSLAEIELLTHKFPHNIKLFGCFKDENMFAGVVVYESDQVARSQYIASSELGRKYGALDLLFSYLINDYYWQKPFLDLGTSDEDDGRCLNKGLIDQKEGFGARVVVHDHYEIDLLAYRPGSLIRAMEWA